MAIQVMHREVCLKHRKNRRETLQRVRTQFEFAAVFVLFVVSGAGITVRAAFCGHRSRAGCLIANQAMPVQFRLTAPIFKNTAGASLRSRVSKTLRARGSTETPCHFHWAARLVRKSAGLHPAVRGA